MLLVHIHVRLASCVASRSLIGLHRSLHAVQADWVYPCTGKSCQMMFFDVHQYPWNLLNETFTLLGLGGARVAGRQPGTGTQHVQVRRQGRSFQQEVLGGALDSPREKHKSFNAL